MQHCEEHNPNDPYFKVAESIGKFPTAVKCRDGTLAMRICSDQSKPGTNHHVRKLFKMLLPPRDIFGRTEHTAALVSHINNHARGSPSEAELNDEIVETMNATFIKGPYDMAIKVAREKSPGASSRVRVVISFPQCFQGTAATLNDSPTFNKFQGAVRAAGIPATVDISLVPEHMAALRGALLSGPAPSCPGLHVSPVLSFSRSRLSSLCSCADDPIERWQNHGGGLRGHVRRKP